MPRIGDLIHQHSLPVTGTSYTADMWSRSKHQEILEDVKQVVEGLHKLIGR